MKEQARNLQYTIRGIPPELDRALRRKATRQKRSLNQLVIDELTAATLGRQRREDFSDVTGKWIPDPAFDKIVAAQRQIDAEKWK